MTSLRIALLTASLAFGGSAVDAAWAQSKAEIQNMDRDGDRIITRAEWQGERTAFRQHDTNRDGILSGTEVWEARDRRRRGRVSNVQTAAEFSSLDRNRDNRVTDQEWPFDRRSFTRADANRDNVVSRAEFLNADGWSGRELGRFRDYDANNDGVIARGEWTESHLAFMALDQNRDNQVTRQEFRGVAATSGVSERSDAYRAGYQRGQIEGRAAGREDRDHNRNWDLEGQRELDSADSGYESRYGLRAEYQAGYRDGFRLAYRDGWDRR